MAKKLYVVLALIGLVVVAGCSGTPAKPTPPSAAAQCPRSPESANAYYKGIAQLPQPTGDVVSYGASLTDPTHCIETVEITVGIDAANAGQPDAYAEYASDKGSLKADFDGDVLEIELGARMTNPKIHLEPITLTQADGAQIIRKVECKSVSDPEVPTFCTVEVTNKYMFDIKPEVRQVNKRTEAVISFQFYRG